MTLEMHPDTPIGTRIKTVRKCKRIRQYKLAEDLGFSRKKMWQIEMGHIIPALDEAATIAQALDISLLTLLPHAALPTSDLPTDTNGQTLPEESAP